MVKMLVTAVLATSLSLVSYSVTDNFNRSDGSPGANWTDVLDCSGCVIDTNEFRGPNLPAAFIDRAILYTASSFSADQTAQITMIAVGASRYTGLCLRCVGSGATLDGYVLYITNSNMYWFMFVDGVVTGLLQTVGATPGSGVPIRGEISGTTLRVFYDLGGGFSQVGTDLTDSTYSAAGHPGIYFSNSTAANGAIVDDFIATGEIGGGSSFIPGIVNTPVRGGVFIVRTWADFMKGFTNVH